MMRASWVAALLLLMAAGAAVVWSGCGAEDSATQSAARPTNMGTRSDVHVPEFLPEDEAEVRRIIAADPQLKALRGASSIEIESVGLWHVLSTKLGGGALITLSPPVTGDYQLPTVRFQQNGCDDVTNPDYERATLPVHVEELSKVDILVDLRSDRVVAIRPLDFDQVLDLSTPDPKSTRGFPQQC